MKNRVPVLSIFFLLLIGCKTNTQLSKGKFFHGKIYNHEKFFVHDIEQNPNDLVKITDTGGYGYYSWKTIKTLHLLRNDSLVLKAQKLDSTAFVSVYNTITNDSLLQFRNDKLAYIRKEKNVHINNLYFIDDYRCIYLSYDDNRAQDTETIIPLFFDKKNYKINRKIKKRFEQYLRGYYTIKADNIFFHFESPYDPRVNYFVKGKIKNNFNSIEFSSMTVPNSPNELYEDGYNADLKEFKNIFHQNAQPVFETVEPISDLIYIPQNYISMGFELNNNRYKLNKLHQRLKDKYKDELKEDDTLIISKITYTICKDEDNENCGYRTYYLYKYGLLSNKVYTIDEYIELDETSEDNESLIDTW